MTVILLSNSTRIDYNHKVRCIDSMIFNKNNLCHYLLMINVTILSKKKKCIIMLKYNGAYLFQHENQDIFKIKGCDHTL